MQGHAHHLSCCASPHGRRPCRRDRARFEHGGRHPARSRGAGGGGSPGRRPYGSVVHAAHGGACRRRDRLGRSERSGGALPRRGSVPCGARTCSVVVYERRPGDGGAGAHRCRRGSGGPRRVRGRRDHRVPFVRLVRVARAVQPCAGGCGRSVARFGGCGQAGGGGPRFLLPVPSGDHAAFGALVRAYRRGVAVRPARHRAGACDGSRLPSAGSRLHVGGRHGERRRGAGGGTADRRAAQRHRHGVLPACVRAVEGGTAAGGRGMLP